MSKPPTISAVIPCHNSAAFVGHTLASLQAQTFTDWEAILVDDGSTDDTGQILASWTKRDKRIRLVRQNNQGLGKARNVGILDARGKLIHFLDADDWMLAEAYAKMTTRLLNEPGIAGAYCGTKIATENGIITNDHKRNREERITFEKVALKNHFAVHSVLIRRDVFNVVGLFDETLKHCQDWDLWGRVFRCGFPLVPVQGLFAVYRMVRTSLSSRHDTFWRAGIEVLQRLYSKDHRCHKPVEAWVNGADKTQYPLSIQNWASYCLPRAILSGDLETIEEIMAAMTSDTNTVPEPRKIGGTLLRGLVICNPDGRKNFMAMWQLRQDLIVYVLTRIGKAARKPTYVSDVLGNFLWGVQRLLGIRESLRINATVPGYLNYLLPFVFKEAERRTRRLLLSPMKRLS
jgi:glycosyltransferase involved in cell wall biosynthesis